jgi:Zn-dependent protease with chaperone function
MDYLAHGLILALAWFLVVSALASAVVAGAIGRRAASMPTESPAFWFGVRLFPSALATAFVTALFVPSYLAYEPRELVEGFDLTLTALAIAALALCVIGAVRAVGASRAANARTAEWMRHARPIALEGTNLPAFEIDADAPLMALVGILRPRLLVTRGLVDALTAEELGASVTHEIGHSRAWDNVKRLAMRAAPDLLGVGEAARTIERRWAAAAERHADAYAAGGAARCALASALVKVARLMPAADAPTSTGAWRAAWEPISTLVGGGDLAARVEGLLDDRTPARTPARFAWVVATTTAFIASIAAYAPLIRIVHSATEVLVRALP